AVMPFSTTNCADLMAKIREDIPSHYADVQVVSQDEIVHQDVPAIVASFSGMDTTHPGTRTQSLVMALIRDGKAYVVSARTNAEYFDARRPALEKMVRSLQFLHKPSHVDTTASARPVKAGRQVCTGSQD
ncbi:MAG TPA: hypothetical protein VGS41_11000, partial [Chthonomonadales bacterium]|nr:hypothetical protein [Chthonomonadales bacterium]